MEKPMGKPAVEEGKRQGRLYNKKIEMSRRRAERKK